MLINKFKKIGFVVHVAEMFNHYGPVWEKMDVNEFQIIVCGSDFERKRTIELAKEIKINYIIVDEVINQRYKYPILVSNHPFGEHHSEPLINLIGIYQVRFMYALGKSKYNFSEWNSLYHIILCFGPYQADSLAFCDSVIKLQMGYPRYDKYFNMVLNKEKLLNELGCDPEKKTIVWLPTWVELSSITLYSEAISKLSEQYNIIVKTHPLSLEIEPSKIKLLEKLPFTRVITSIFDNLYLYTISDYVFCDYGGTAFGAIYLDKNLLLLNVPNAVNDSLTGKDSPDILLREDIVNIDYDISNQLSSILNDKLIWKKQKAIRRKIRNKYFAPNYGFSSQVAALAIKNTEIIVNAY